MLKVDSGFRIQVSRDGYLLGGRLNQTVRRLVRSFPCAEEGPENAHGQAGPSNGHGHHLQRTTRPKG